MSEQDWKCYSVSRRRVKMTWQTYAVQELEEWLTEAKKVKILTSFVTAFLILNKLKLKMETEVLSFMDGPIKMMSFFDDPLSM